MFTRSCISYITICTFVLFCYFSCWFVRAIYNVRLLIISHPTCCQSFPTGVQPRRVSGSPKDGWHRRRMRGQTPSLMPENGQPLWVWLNSKSLIKLYFYRDLLYDIKGTGNGMISQAEKVYTEIPRKCTGSSTGIHTRQRLFWPGGLSIRQLQVTTRTKFQMSIDHLMSNKVFRIGHRSKGHARLDSGYMWTIKGPMWFRLSNSAIYLPV